MTVTVTRNGAVALVIIDNPPVNALSQPVRQALMEALRETEADPAVDAVVLSAASRTFAAGADIREFGQPPAPPHLPDVIRAIETASKPWVAALHGSALGGGLELVLGCAWRIAAKDARLGLPEVTLGLVPGAGGTVRLPRLIGAFEALDMIASGRPGTAAKAFETGLIDAIAQYDLLAEAVEFAGARMVGRRPIPLLDRPAPVPANAADWSAATSRIKARARGQTAPLAAIEAVELAITLPGPVALSSERQRFLTLRDGQQSKALRHLFLAERATGRIARAEGAAPAPLRQIGVVGGGTMGAGIAAACLLSGLAVTMVERDAEALASGEGRVLAVLSDSHARNLVTDTELDAMKARLTGSTAYDALNPADLVIEAVFEDMAVKAEVFAALDAATGPETILASNTSYLDIDVLAAATRDPARVIGLHFFSPAHVMKLLELIVTGKASPEALATGLALGKRLGKITVPAGVGDGFIGNRIMSAYRRAADEMMEDGTLPWDIDRAMRGYGFAMGLYEMQDLAGLDISWAMRKRQAATRDPDARYIAIADRLCEAGRFGRKTGRGWYIHDGGTARPDAEVEAIILAEATRKGISRRPFGDGEIMERILSAMATTGQAVLAEGIAARAADIDVVMVNGYGFPRWKGGPMYQAGLI